MFQELQDVAQINGNFMAMLGVQVKGVVSDG